MKKRDYRTMRLFVDCALLVAVVMALGLFFIFVAAAQSAPPRQAVPAKGNLPALRHSLQVVRRQRHYAAIGCFHVAPKQWVCPLPDPRANG